MKRPGYDLTWEGIRRRWASSQRQTNSTNESILNEHYKSFSVSSLDVININPQSSSFIVEQEQQRSNSAIEFCISLLPKIQSVNYHHHHNLSRESHSCEIEMIRSELRTIISHLATLTQQVRQQEELDAISQDWKFAAMIIDRLCLILFSASMALFTALTLLSTPNFFKLQ